jgi:hypothetical protein
MVQISWAEVVEPSGSHACAKRGHSMVSFASRHLDKADRDASVQRDGTGWEVIRETA